MKRKLVLSAVLFAGMVVANPMFAQIKRLKTVRNDMTRNIEKDLAKSKYDIDLVIQDPETSNMAAAWGWRGVIYTEIAYLSDTSELKKTLDPTGNASLIAAEAMTKFYSYSEEQQEEFDAKDNVKYNLPYAILKVYYDGEDALRNGKDFKIVKQYMDYVVALMPYDVDKVANNNSVTTEKAYYYNWYAAYQDTLIDTEIIYLEKLAAVPNYLKSDIFIRLSQIYSDKGEFDKAISYLNKGKEKIPQDANRFLEQEINIELGRNNQVAMLTKFNEAIAGDPTNATYYFSRGVTFHQLKTKELEAQEKQYKSNVALSPSVYYFSQAMKDYQKALEIDPGNYDALNNLAVLMFDSANYVYKQMTRVAGQYEKLRALAIDLYKQADVKFEALRQSGYLKDQDLINLLIDMKTCAAKTGNEARKKEIEAMIQAEKKKLAEKKD